MQGKRAAFFASFQQIASVPRKRLELRASSVTRGPAGCRCRRVRRVHQLGPGRTPSRSSPSPRPAGGLTPRHWPRSSQDPLLPGEVWLESAVDLMRRDLLRHAVIAGAATGGLAASLPHRSAEGGPLAQPPVAVRRGP
jgi:hypothetical protein